MYVILIKSDCWHNFSYYFILGDNESGKTTLIAKLQGVEDPKKGSGLEYAYIDVRDEYRDGMSCIVVMMYCVLHLLSYV